MFINRDKELATIQQHLDRRQASLLVLYGRRRIGKTALLRQACRGRRHIFFTADLGSSRQQLDAFSATVLDARADDGLTGAVFPSWDQALQYCRSQADAEPLTLVLDEFQHMVMSDPVLPSVMQRLWDSAIADSRLSIVLCGSYVSFMERKILGAKNPLYGRRTGQLQLQPLRYRDAARFFPSWSAIDCMSILGVVGGIPAYLRLIEQGLDLADNIERVILSEGAPLYDEPRFLMMEELREPQTYFALCRAIAHGRGRPNEISQSAGLAQGSNISPYLATLREIRLLERRVPASARNPERSRRGLYRLADPFLRFWFRFVSPNRTALEAGDARMVWSRKIEPHLSQLVAESFEDACCEYLWHLNRAGELPATYDRIGGWWRANQEVDIIAVADDGPLLLAECKWSTRPVGENVLENLEGKIAAVAADLERSPTRIDLALFSRSGFTPGMQRLAERRGVLLATIEDAIRY